MIIDLPDGHTVRFRDGKPVEESPKRERGRRRRRKRPSAIHRITPCFDAGDLRVYRREWKEPGLKRYVVMRTRTGTILEEFQHKREAIRWASQNSSG